MGLLGATDRRARTAPVPGAAFLFQRQATLVVAALVLTACTTLGPVTSRPIPPVADAAFTVDGRLSAKRGGEGVTVGFSWRHDPPRDTLTVATPLGQGIALLVGDAGRGEVEIVLADGRREVANDWTALTSRALGFSLPVAGLAAWVRGGPHGDSPATAETDAAGRASVLRQDGWEIVYDYADAEARRPARLRLVGNELELRVVVERWH